MPPAFIIIFSFILLLVFPLFTSGYLAIDYNRKILKAEITVFGVRVFNFNAIIKGLKIYVKQSFKKAYRVSLSFKWKRPKNIPKIRHLNILSSKLLLNVGINENGIAPLSAVFALNAAGNTITDLTRAKKPYFKAENKVNIYLNESGFSLFLRLNAVFNLIDIMHNLFLFLTEKIHYAVGK